MGRRCKTLKGGADDASSPWGYYTLLAVFLLGILCLFLYMYGKKRTAPDSDAVCMTKKEYEKLIRPVERAVERPVERAVECKPKVVMVAAAMKGQARDYRVVEDQLYPPLNRTDTMTHEMLERNIDHRNMYVPTNDTQDNYRLVGYLINKDPDGAKDAGGNNWKLFARQKDRNTSDFYMIPSNNNYDIKIHVKDDMVVGDRLRDVYTIPKNITFNSPMLNTTSYEFVELPKADLASSSRYL